VELPQDFGLRQPSGAFRTVVCNSKAAESCRTPKRYRVLGRLIVSMRVQSWRSNLIINSLAIRGLGGAVIGCLCIALNAHAQPAASLPKATIDGTGPGWRALAKDDLVNVNCDTNTWTWTNGIIHCTGRPVGVIRTKKLHTNFELVAQWRHLQSGGNSGIFV